MNRLKTVLKQIIPKRWKVLYKREIIIKKTRGYKAEDSKQIFQKIHDDNFWSNTESVSGNGSDNRSTEYLKTELEKLLLSLNTQSFADIPCGDFNWMQHVNLSSVKYIGGDIVKALVEKNNRLYQSDNLSFELLDITNNNLPKVDILLCRDCLVHLSFKEIYSALINIKKSNSTYLLTTSFIDQKQNFDINTGDWRPLNFRKTPFNFKEPELIITENSALKYPDKALCLWKISNINISKTSYFIKSNILYRMLLN
ncbi:MAG: hypothetical protein AB8B52_01785 [Winogradskyella sp.]|uniref:hypothetical protein n=1 Tax=Winogradskyella sp. TaxID=1883156 RepID=UPI00385E18DB